MAESVDALVSNTSGAIHPGSIPGLGTNNDWKSTDFRSLFFMMCQKVYCLQLVLAKINLLIGYGRNDTQIYFRDITVVCNAAVY